MALRSHHLILPGQATVVASTYFGSVTFGGMDPSALPVMPGPACLLSWGGRWEWCLPQCLLRVGHTSVRRVGVWRIILLLDRLRRSCLWILIQAPILLKTKTQFNANKSFTGSCWSLFNREQASGWELQQSACVQLAFNHVVSHCFVFIFYLYS